jgi:ABC-type multidrug transport system fused ATPase/permease subunit
MTERRATCFVSYCHENADLNSIHYLVRQLRELSNNQIHFFFDENATGGTKLTNFMSRIKNVDAILLLLTPQYRRRVLERKGGVYYIEFTEILRRFHDDEERANDHTKRGDDAVKPPPVCFKPLLFAGDFESACPEETREYLCKDFSGYRAQEDAKGELFTTRPVITRYRSKIEEIASEILARHAASAPDFEVRFRAVLRRLFLETKHERLTGDDVFQKVAKSIFVKTHAYERVKEQVSYILVGRKGSGKSTITHYLPELGKKHYKEPININVNGFGLEYLYGMLSTKQVRSEVQTVVERSRLFEWTWEAFIIVCCMEVLMIEAMKGSLTAPHNANDLAAFSNFLHRVSGESNRTECVDKNATFRWCLAQVLD